ncbi:hypothetical protein PHMEG_00027756 [Phytophthora megakarya]|uniref:Uncharacterized protein n=1 Tax=Phytophthora megakarya TaxID=4795 RepID=A0A225V6L9_9STRA|nr:hypothetical protein PHMEG_00027756 [Phytophthora megakarya]
MKAYWTINRARYLNTREPVPRAPDSLNFWLKKLDDKRFKEGFRVTRLQFTQIVELIQDNSVLYNEPNMLQTPAWCQLLVVLYRFRCDGNGVVVERDHQNLRRCWIRLTTVPRTPTKGGGTPMIRDQLNFLTLCTRW